MSPRCLWWLALIAVSVGSGGELAYAQSTFRLATFKADVTIPLGHRCMGVLPTKSLRIVDRLEAHGLVLLGADQPLVLVAVDWCEIRNQSYDQWRDALAKAAGTTRQRVLVCSLHQHDAPVVDLEAQTLLDEVGLQKELFDTEFHDRCVAHVATALRAGLESARRVTHIGIGQAKVDKVASNRRFVNADGRVTFSRGSASGGQAAARDAPEGEIDPMLKTLSFWDGDLPLLELHAYATHPMSYYGRGGVSADFVGMARRMRQLEMPDVAQIYVSGCSGDVTAGKYNDGTPGMRTVLAERLHAAMKVAWQNTKRHPLERAQFRSAPLELPFQTGEAFSKQRLQQTLHNDKASVRDKILAAMALSTRRRLERRQPIDLPCIDLGVAQLVLFPGEAFVGYQLMAQQMRPDSFVVSIGYGECWPGYIPTRRAFDEQFGHSWRWVAPGCEPRVREALEKVLAKD